MKAQKIVALQQNRHICKCFVPIQAHKHIQFIGFATKKQMYNVERKKERALMHAFLKIGTKASERSRRFRLVILALSHTILLCS
jgi:hypothetical protein